MQFCPSEILSQALAPKDVILFSDDSLQFLGWLCSSKSLLEHAASVRGALFLPYCSFPSLDFRSLLCQPLISKVRILFDGAMPICILTFLTSFSSPALYIFSPINYTSCLYYIVFLQGQASYNYIIPNEFSNTTWSYISSPLYGLL